MCIGADVNIVAYNRRLTYACLAHVCSEWTTEISSAIMLCSLLQKGGDYLQRATGLRGECHALSKKLPRLSTDTIFCICLSYCTSKSADLCCQSKAAC